MQDTRIASIMRSNPQLVIVATAEWMIFAAFSGVAVAPESS
jgi:hypothetical protein